MAPKQISCSQITLTRTVVTIPTSAALKLLQAVAVEGGENPDASSRMGPSAPNRRPRQICRARTDQDDTVVCRPEWIKFGRVTVEPRNQSLRCEVPKIETGPVTVLYQDQDALNQTVLD